MLEQSSHYRMLPNRGITRQWFVDRVVLRIAQGDANCTQGEQMGFSLLKLVVTALNANLPPVHQLLPGPVN
jgi:hypothetical protein